MLENAAQTNSMSPRGFSYDDPLPMITKTANISSVQSNSFNVSLQNEEHSSMLFYVQKTRFQPSHFLPYEQMHTYGLFTSVVSVFDGSWNIACLLSLFVSAFSAWRMSAVCWLLREALFVEMNSGVKVLCFNFKDNLDTNKKNNKDYIVQRRTW